MNGEGMDEWRRPRLTFWWGLACSDLASMIQPGRERVTARFIYHFMDPAVFEPYD